MNAGPEAPAHTVSEGQGYGMVIVALMAGHDPAAHERFDGLARYVLDHPSSVDERLLGWAQDARCRDVEGGDSATDGDLDAAYGLLLAHAQWGSGGAIDYLGAARRMLDGILAEDVHPDTNLTTLGDWTARDHPQVLALDAAVGLDARPLLRLRRGDRRAALDRGARGAPAADPRGCRAGPACCPTSSARTAAPGPAGPGSWRARTTAASPGTRAARRGGSAPTRR